METISKREELKRSHPHDENGYNNHGCRGPVCREAHAVATMTSREERRAWTAKHGLPGHVEHGASAYTNWGCRCAVCREGHREECAQYR